MNSLATPGSSEVKTASPETIVRRLSAAAVAGSASASAAMAMRSVRVTGEEALTLDRVERAVRVVARGDAAEHDARALVGVALVERGL